MINKETIVRRLGIAKYLYKLGYAQSQLSETIAYPCLLNFHDATEIFLKLVAESANVKSDKFRFLEYWDNIPALSMRESMKHLNDRRNNLKHKGILPAKADLEISRVNVTDFFEENTKAIFDLDFKDISLINLVSYPSVRNYLEVAQQELEKNNLINAIENVAYAFNEMLVSYEKNKIDLYSKSPFFFGDNLSFFRNGSDKLQTIDRRLAEDYNKMRKSIELLQYSVKIMSLGIDYKKYALFRILTPEVYKHSDGSYKSYSNGDRKWTKENTQFCIDFTIESSLKLQEFEFDINNLIDDEPPEIEYVSGDFESGLIFKELQKK